MCQELKPIQALIVEMQYIGEGNMFYISQSDWHFFDKYSILVVSGTKFMLLALLKIYSCDEIGIIMSKVEYVFIVVVCVLVSGESIMSFDVQIGLCTISPD